MATPLAVAEMDYLVDRAAAARDAQETLWRDLDAGAYAVRWWADALTETLAIARRHPFARADRRLARRARRRLRTRRIATVDQHFRSMTTPDGEPFVLLPDDA